MPGSPAARAEMAIGADEHVAAPIVGAPGTVAGVTLFDAAETALFPALFVAVTVKV